MEKEILDHAAIIMKISFAICGTMATLIAGCWAVLTFSIKLWQWYIDKRDARESAQIVDIKKQMEKDDIARQEVVKSLQKLTEAYYTLAVAVKGTMSIRTCSKLREKCKDGHKLDILTTTIHDLGAIIKKEDSKNDGS